MTRMAKKPKLFELDDVLAILQELIDGASQAEVGRTIGKSRQYVSDVMRNRRPPGEPLLELIGYERVLMYRPKGTLSQAATDP